MSINHIPAILSLLIALAVGYLTLTVESRVVHQEHALEKLRHELEDTRKKLEETTQTASFLDDQIFALKEDFSKGPTAGIPVDAPVTRAQLDAALKEYTLIMDEKIKPLMARPIELKIWDMANPTAEVTPLVPPPEAGAKEEKKGP